MSDRKPRPAPKIEKYFGDTHLEIGYSRVWFNLLRVQRFLVPKVAKVLRDEGIKDPIWYEILESVEITGPDGCLMASLESRLFLAQYALSRHVTRMEKAGLIRREYIADGRRKQLLFVTDQAKGLHARVWPKYYQTIMDELSERFTKDEAYELARYLIRLTY